MGGLLTLDSFVAQFPELDTSSSSYLAMSPADQRHRSNIEGMSSHRLFESNLGIK